MNKSCTNIDLNNKDKIKLELFTEVIPICSYCKKVRNLEDKWMNFDNSILKEFEMKFSHGICPDCLKENYPDFYDDFFANKES